MHRTVRLALIILVASVAVASVVRFVLPVSLGLHVMTAITVYPKEPFTWSANDTEPRVRFGICESYNPGRYPTIVPEAQSTRGAEIISSGPTKVELYRK